MANNHSANGIHGNALEVSAPGVDYGLKNDDGFDPSKYDFYNPSNRNAATTFVVRLDEQHLNPETKSYRAPQTPEFYETDTPPPLSPIEELDDDLNIFNPRRSSDCAPHTLIENQEKKGSELLLADLSSDNDYTIESITPLEKRSELLFSREHLLLILADSTLSLKFTDFLRTYRPDSVPMLAYYLDAIKAVKAIKYAEAIIKGLEPIPGHAFTSEANSATMAWVMEDKADRALDVLVKDDLPAFIAYIYVRTVDVALVDRVTGNEDAGLRGIADGLAEVFVLSDPSRPDNPIVFSSEEFHRMTGYPRTEFLGRNCRTLGGARTSPSGISRFRASLDAEREHCEVLLNYRKDGSPFINLVMCVPLRDQSGKVRYYLGAQLDITGLVDDCTALATLKKIVERNDHGKPVTDGSAPKQALQGNEFEQLSEAFNPQELEKLIALRQRQQLQPEDCEIYKDSEERRRRQNSPSTTPFTDLEYGFQLNGHGSAPPLGYYKTYLLVRPYPSLRILFASPDLRIPGILQSPLLSRIGGSTRVRGDLAHALQVGRKVTAKVQWISKTATTSRSRWIHCTPLLGVNDTIGVWMVILVDDEDNGDGERQQASHESRIASRLDVNHTAEAISRDDKRYRATSSGFSTSVWSDSVDSKNSDEVGKSEARQPVSRQPSEKDDAVASSLMVGGRAFSVNSNGERISIDEKKKALIGGADDRPTSQGRTVLPIQSAMQPKVRIGGRSSLEGDEERKVTINMPGRRVGQKETSMDGRPSPRRTYRSLSPYGILFED